MVEGIDVNLGGKVFTIPPLNFKSIKTLKNDIDALGNISGDLGAEQMDKIINIVHCALKRNYPEISRDELEEIIDLGNMLPTIRAIMGNSGFVKKKVTEQETISL